MEMNELTRQLEEGMEESNQERAQKLDLERVVPGSYDSRLPSVDKINVMKGEGGQISVRIEGESKQGSTVGETFTVTNEGVLGKVPNNLEVSRGALVEEIIEILESHQAGSEEKAA